MGWYNLGLADIELAKKNVGDRNSLLTTAISHLKQANGLKTELGAYDLAWAYALIGELPNALAWLKQRHGQITTITEESDFDNLKDFPDFKEYLFSISPA